MQPDITKTRALDLSADHGADLTIHENPDGSRSVAVNVDGVCVARVRVAAELRLLLHTHERAGVELLDPETGEPRLGDDGGPLRLHPFKLANVALDVASWLCAGGDEERAALLERRVRARLYDLGLVGVTDPEWVEELRRDLELEVPPRPPAPDLGETA